MKRKMLSEEEKQQIPILYKELGTQRAVAEKLGVSSSTIGRYLREFQQQNETEEEKEERTKDKDELHHYLIFLFGESSTANWVQIERMKRQYGYTYKQIHQSLRFYYEIQKHKVDPQHKTVGIVPYVFEQAKQYFELRQMKQEEVEKILMVKEKQDIVKVIVPQEKKTRKRKKIDLLNI